MSNVLSTNDHDNRSHVLEIVAPFNTTDPLQTPLDASQATWPVDLSFCSELCRDKILDNDIEKEQLQEKDQEEQLKKRSHINQNVIVFGEA
ncbi:hypothetical protein L1887_03731 [Cichorium endivia]|nr:hypothetical protein L1887_03731 [Cichorium endivia]